MKKYIVDLTDAERTQLLDLIKKGTLGARKLTRAHILLGAHEGATDAAIAAALHVGSARLSARARSLSRLTWSMLSASGPVPAPSASSMPNRKHA